MTKKNKSIKVMLPKVYFQIEKIREIWLRSNSESASEMVTIFDEYLKEIKAQAIADMIDSIPLTDEVEADEDVKNYVG